MLSANTPRVLAIGPVAHSVPTWASGGRILRYPTSQVSELRHSGPCGPQAPRGQEDPPFAARQSGPAAHTPDHQVWGFTLFLPHNLSFRRNLRGGQCRRDQRGHIYWESRNKDTPLIAFLIHICPQHLQGHPITGTSCLLPGPAVAQHPRDLQIAPTAPASLLP